MMMGGLLVFLMGLGSVVLKRAHFLSVLLSLELMMLGNFIVLSMFSFLDSYDSILFFMVIVVSEASLGLGILILSVYFYGEDMFNSFSVLSC